MVVLASEDCARYLYIDIRRRIIIVSFNVQQADQSGLGQMGGRFPSRAMPGRFPFHGMGHQTNRPSSPAPSSGDISSSLLVGE